MKNNTTIIQGRPIIDSTLREGEQTPGVSFAVGAKKAIIDGLAAIGISEIELGLASPLSHCSKELIAHSRRHHPSLVCSLWSRCHPADIDHGIQLKPDIMALSIPASRLHLHDKLGRNEEWAMEAMTSAIKQVCQAGITATIGFEDASRAEPAFLMELALKAETAGASRIRLADTIGRLSPATMGHLVATLKHHLRTATIGVHTHNDFGMATANAISALEHGACYVDATVMGLGERAGCARLEELAGFLAINHNTGYNTRAIAPLSTLVARLSGVDIPNNQPIVGREIFACETGLHLQGLHNNPETYEPFSPELVGKTRDLRIGPKAGRKALLTHLKSLGLELPEDLTDAQIDLVRHHLAVNSQMTAEDFYALLFSPPLSARQPAVS